MIILTLSLRHVNYCYLIQVVLNEYNQNYAKQCEILVPSIVSTKPVITEKRIKENMCCVNKYKIYL